MALAQKTAQNAEEQKPIVASYEGAMIAPVPEFRDAMIARNWCVGVMALTEMTTDIHELSRPSHSRRCLLQPQHPAAASPGRAIIVA